MGKPILSDHDFAGGAKITGLPAAAGAGQPVTYEQMNAAVEGVAWKDSVRVSSIANINLAAPGAAIDGITMAANDRFLAKDQTTQAQNGIYIWNGAAVPATRASDASTSPELEGAVVTVEEGTSAGSTFRQTQVNFVLDTGAVIWTSFGTAAPAASETTAGVAELATQAEADAGTDDGRTITPLKMANWSGRKRKASGTLGDGSALSFNIDHNFNTRDVTVEIYKNSGNYDTVDVDVTRPTVNRVTIAFAAAPAVTAYAYTILA